MNETTHISLFPPEFVGILSSTDRSSKMADVLYSGVCFFNVHKLLMASNKTLLHRAKCDLPLLRKTKFESLGQRARECEERGRRQKLVFYAEPAADISREEGESWGAINITTSCLTAAPFPDYAWSDGSLNVYKHLHLQSKCQH